MQENAKSMQNQRGTIKRLKSLIKMLEGDIAMFGPAGDDVSRLNSYKSKLKELKY